MKRTSLAVTILLLSSMAPAFADVPRALPAGKLPDDARLAPPKSLNGYFPFTPPATKAEWDKRADYVRRQILVSQGLWPLPTKTPLNAVIHGKTEFPDYSVEKAYFESTPGFFVTGNLYRPKNVAGKIPAVLFAHGHWQNARLSEETEDNLRKEIATGQERFERGGRSRFQSMCVQLARMGCVVWQWDMLSDSDSHQLGRAVVHTFGKQRPEMNTVENWGLYSPQAEAHLQSIMGLQTWNSIRSLDFVLSLPEVDAARTAITGASGGGTQTMLLAAVDPRVALSFPAVMVSTAMQGGCTCENASLLRVDTGNIEFAALFAPKPQGLTTADDWTKELSTKGFPDLKKLYTLLGAADNVIIQRGEYFPHNYNAVSRSAFYTFLNRHFRLGAKDPVIEHDYDVLPREQLTVWDTGHPEPPRESPEFERKLLKYLTDDADKQLRASAASPERLRQEIGSAVEVLIGRTLAGAGEVEWLLENKTDRESYVEMSGLVRNKTHHEELPVIWLYPKKWNGRAIVWLDDAGKAGLYNADGSVKPAVQQLVNSGATVLGADLLFQGEFLANGQPVKETRRVADNNREAAAYTLGYNHSLFAQRTHDILTLVKYLKTAEVAGHPKPSSIDVAGFGGAGPLVAAARAVSGDAINRAAIDTSAFRFGKLLDFRDPQFLPGGAKYLDLPGFLALGAPQRLWLAGEGTDPPIVSDAYRTAGQINRLMVFTGEPGQKTSAAAAWLLE